MAKMDNNKIIYGYYQSPIGLIELQVSNDALCSLKIISDNDDLLLTEVKNFTLLKVIKQLDQYFNKQLQQFNLPLSILTGTYFQQQVWSTVAKIPYGAVVTYQQIAVAINKSKAYRAVGSALAKNPLAIIIPCHRVVNNQKNIINYFYGSKKKQYLLNLEKKSA